MMTLWLDDFDFAKWDKDRIDQRMLLVDVARRAKCSLSYVSIFASGRRRRSVRLCTRMAKALGHEVERYYRAPKRRAK